MDSDNQYSAPEAEGFLIEEKDIGSGNLIINFSSICTDPFLDINISWNTDVSFFVCLLGSF